MFYKQFYPKFKIVVIPLIVFLVLKLFVNSSDSFKCYICEPRNNTEQDCLTSEWKDDLNYTAECDYKFHYCDKYVTQMHTVRKCGNPDIKQKGCQDLFLRSGDIMTYCRCKRDLCNSQKQLTLTNHTLIIVLTICLLNQYYI